MFVFLGLTGSDLISYGFLFIVGCLVHLYVRVKRWFGTESDQLGDDADSDSFWGDDGGDD
ncbi:hypothetical protein [Spirosoma areae]